MYTTFVTKYINSAQMYTTMTRAEGVGGSVSHRCMYS